MKNQSKSDSTNVLNNYYYSHYIEIRFKNLLKILNNEISRLIYNI